MQFANMQIHIDTGFGRGQHKGAGVGWEKGKERRKNERTVRGFVMCGYTCIYIRESVCSLCIHVERMCVAASLSRCRSFVTNACVRRGGWLRVVYWRYNIIKYIYSYTLKVSNIFCVRFFFCWFWFTVIVRLRFSLKFSLVGCKWQEIHPPALEGAESMEERGEGVGGRTMFCDFVAQDTDADTHKRTERQMHTHTQSQTQRKASTRARIHTRTVVNIHK